MISVQNVKSWCGLQVGYYDTKKVAPLMPLLTQEFPNWPLSRIESYMNLVTTKNRDISGILVAKNEANYYVGMLIYTFQQTNLNEKYNIFVVENLIASSLILQSQVFLCLVERGIEIARNKSCDLLELPKIDNKGYALIKAKYNKEISNSQGFRTYLKLSKH